MVSVICPIYNEEKYIAQCIESVLAQDYPKEDLEVLFVDGMSSDRTREIVEAYTQQYTFLKLIDNEERNGFNYLKPERIIYNKC
jgi:glycosyltransferase involved in cell wall biosynthesis